MGMNKNLDTVIGYLKENNLDALRPGRNEVDGEAVYVNRLDYTTIPESEAIWEGHARYGDVHIMISGREQIGVTDVRDLERTVVREDADFIGYEGNVYNWYPMRDGDVLVVFPEDAHLVKVLLDEAMPVSRAVFKFAL